MKGNLKAVAFWDLVIDRILRRLDGWKKTFLFLNGKIILIQSCLFHTLTIFFLSLFKIPKSVASKIGKLQGDFHWLGVGEGKKDHLISRDLVCKLEEYGGLGLGMISLGNCALLGKWLCRFLGENFGLWH